MLWCSLNELMEIKSIETKSKLRSSNTPLHILQHATCNRTKRKATVKFCTSYGAYQPQPFHFLASSIQARCWKYTGWKTVTALVSIPCQTSNLVPNWRRVADLHEARTSGSGESINSSSALDNVLLVLCSKVSVPKITYNTKSFCWMNYFF